MVPDAVPPLPKSAEPPLTVIPTAASQISQKFKSALKHQRSGGHAAKIVSSRPPEATRVEIATPSTPCPPLEAEGGGRTVVLNSRAGRGASGGDKR